MSSSSVSRLSNSLARLSLVLIAALIFGCDSTPSPDGARAELSATNSVAVSLDGRNSADYYYDLAPLDVRERFEATLVGSAGALRLRFQGTGGGRGLVQLVTDEKHPSKAIALDYMENGEVVGSRTFKGRDTNTYAAGTTDREPDSIHYIWYSDGSVEIKYDWVDDNDARGAGTTVTAPDGDRLNVTHIRFVVDDAGIETPEFMEFTSASAFALR